MRFISEEDDQQNDPELVRFSGEEDHGKYLDFVSLHARFVKKREAMLKLFRAQL